MLVNTNKKNEFVWIIDWVTIAFKHEGSSNWSGFGLLMTFHVSFKIIILFRNTNLKRHDIISKESSGSHIVGLLCGSTGDTRDSCGLMCTNGH